MNIRALKYDWYLDKQTRRHTCKTCGWIRDWSENPLWAEEIILDVVTGDHVKRWELAARDIERHNCRRYEATLEVWGRRGPGPKVINPMTGKEIK